MLNVCFSESAFGTLRYSVSAGKMEPSGVVCIPDDLSRGDISNIRDASSRESILLESFGERYVSSNCMPSYNEFYNEIFNHRDIRIWYGNNPHEYCGMLYTVWLLRDEDVKIGTVCCTKTLEREPGTYVYYKHAAEISPEEVPVFIKFEEKLSKVQVEELSEKWERLARENGLLRAYVNSSICTVPVDYYDNLILSYIREVPTTIGAVIGNIFGEEGIVISDSLIAFRIGELIKSGAVRQEGNSESFYKNYIYKGDY